MCMVDVLRLHLFWFKLIFFVCLLESKNNLYHLAARKILSALEEWKKWWRLWHVTNDNGNCGLVSGDWWWSTISAYNG